MSNRLPPGGPGRPRRTLRSLLALLVVAGCRGEAPSLRKDPTIQVPVASAGARPRTPPSTPADESPPSPSASADESPPGPAEVSAEEEERINRGCKHRKNSGRVISCERSEKSGAWAPDRRELEEVMKLVEGSCYCAAGLVKPVGACTRMQGTTAVTLVLGQPGEPTDCRLELRAGEFRGRRFVVADAFNRDVATFYAVIHILERTDRGYQRYFRGYNRVPEALAEAEPGDEISPVMRAEWATLPADLRGFLAPR